MSDRAAFTASLRQFADWLDTNTQYPHPGEQRFLLCLLTNAAVSEFATRFGLETNADDEGNLSANIEFGPVTYHVYGYVDFDTHYAAAEERAAHAWAARTGMRITPQDS
ncbi:hypothetical protein ACWC5I_00855 [Kitasatospora sp. NPDC001574]